MRFRWLLLGAIILSAGLPARSQQPALDTTTFVVLGDGLAAGMGDFSLHEVYQENSFPAQMARQMGALFPQPLIEAPGIGNAEGFPPLPAKSPTFGQTTVRTLFPPSLFIFNLSVPGLRLQDAIAKPPAPPLIQESDPLQTSINFILGYPSLILGEDIPNWAQLEYAEAMVPSMALVSLGYTDAVRAAVAGNPDLLTGADQFRSDYATILGRLKRIYPNPTVIALTVPDPMDSAYFATLAQATAYVGAPANVLAGLYGLRGDDLITLPALMAMGRQILADNVEALPPGSIVSAQAAQQVRDRVRAYNSGISSLAQEHGAELYDLNGLFQSVRSSGVQAGAERLTADYLRGFYSLNGLYPGSTGQGVIANELLKLLNQKFQKSYPLVDLATLAKKDPAARFRPARRSRELR